MKSKKDLMHRFNEITEDEFRCLKLVSIDVLIRAKSFVVNLIYPESHAEFILNNRKHIENAILSIIKTEAKVSVKLTLSHFDRAIFLDSFKVFLKQFPAISSSMEEGDVDALDEGEEKKVILRLNKHIYDACESGKIFDKIKEYLNTNYCDKILTEFIVKEGSEDFNFDFEYEQVPEFALDDKAGRFFKPQNVEEFIGAIIYEPPMYIEDAVKPKNGIVVCGKLATFDECTKKSDGGKYYRFSLEDFTGILTNCVYFPSKATADKITLLKVGKTVVMRGNLEEDKFRQGQLSFKPRDISLCTLPNDFKINRIRRQIDESYKTVFPIPHIKKFQPSLFDFNEEQKPPSKFLLNKTFCVFDIETTGFNPSEAKIIEIAAVKISNGVFTETFSTLINPCVPVPHRITLLTNITDVDVMDKPLIEDVMPDFYKFSADTILVGHNAKLFDLPFISFHAKKQNIYFDNEVMDTLDLARKLFPDIRNYKLETLAEYFKINLDGAHRALNDTLATAEIFVKISEKIKESA